MSFGVLQWHGTVDALMRARWSEVARVVDLALDLEAADRPQLLDRTCSGDAALRGEVERLLAATERAANFLNQPIAADAAPLVSWVDRQECQALAPGTRFGAYEVTGVLGRGGMATVYLAEDHKHHRTVAVKVFDSEIGAAVGREWFLREIEIAAGLHHPHILPLHDSGEVDGRLYYVMPHVEGESLRAAAGPRGPAPARDALRDRPRGGRRAGLRPPAGRRASRHQAGEHPAPGRAGDRRRLRHRPRASTRAPWRPAPTETSAALGTPAYMSPEQATPATATSTAAPTSTRSAACSTRCWRARRRSPANGAGHPRSSMWRPPCLPSRRARPDLPIPLDRAVARALQKVARRSVRDGGEFVEAVDRAALRPSHQPEMAVAGRRHALGWPVRPSSSMAGIGLYPPGSGPIRAQRRTRGLTAILPFRTAGATLAWPGCARGWWISSPSSSAAKAACVPPNRPVLSAWRRLAARTAQRCRGRRRWNSRAASAAGRVIDGSVVGTPEHLTITASLLTLPAAPCTAARALRARPTVSRRS